MDKNNTEINQLKIIYEEIISGCSFVESIGAFVKHTSELDNISIIKQKSVFYERYLKEGLPSESDCLKRIISEGIWPAKNEEEIESLKYIISDNEKNLNKVIPQMQAPIRKILESKKQELMMLFLRKKELIGLTIEDAVEEDIVNFIPYLYLYKDKACKEKLFTSWNDFESLDEKTINQYVEETDKVITKVTESTIKKISVLSFFINPFSYAKENIFTFLNKPIGFLTYNQLTLFALGTRNLNIVSQSEGEPPELIGNTTVQEVVDWYDRNYSILLGKRNQSR